MMTRLFKRNRLRSDTRGVAAVEFGLLAIPFFVILMGGLDLGHQAYMRSVLQGSLNDAARRAAVEDPTFAAAGATLEQRIENTVKGEVGKLAPKATYQVGINNFFDFTGIGNPEKLLTDVDGDGEFDELDGDCFEDLNENGNYDLDAGRGGVGGANDVVFYEVTVTMPRLLPMAELIGFSENMVVSAEAAVRNQPYATQGIIPTVCGEPS